MESIITLEKLTKTFGKNRGVTDLTLDVKEGDIVGFLGPNGSGKSTTINMLMGYSNPTSGSAHIFGRDVTKKSESIRQDIGFLASDMALDGRLTGWQQLNYIGHLRGHFDKAYIQELATRLSCDLNRRIHTLSRGNRQKVALIAAFMNRPKLLLLDEPTSGFDPLIQAEFNALIIEHKKSGGTAFISSHVLDEVQEICDRLVFIREGKIIADTSMDKLLKSAKKEATIVGGTKSLLQALKRLNGTSNIHVNGTKITFSYDGDSTHLVQLLAKFLFADFTIHEADLEATFMEYYKKEKGEKNV